MLIFLIEEAHMKSSKPPKQITWTVSLPEPEYDAMQTLRLELGESSGGKIKKSMLVRAACRMLMAQDRAAIANELSKIDAQ
jgi:hypothetical protein